MTYEEGLQKFNEYGEVVEVRHPIALVSGIPGARAQEVVVFDSGERGQVISLAPAQATVLILANQSVRVGSKVARTGKHLAVPVSQALLGTVVNSLGEVVLSEKAQSGDHEWRPVEAPPPSIMQRDRVTKPLLTGVSLVDLLMPLGKGQRELVVGDKLTGKSSFLLSVLKNQAAAGMVVIYAAIGKPTKDVRGIYDFAASCGALLNTIVVTGRPNDSPSLIYFTPYTAMAIAEYFQSQGRDVLVLLDDLSTNARFYREVSLLARKFPGRDSYPGDVFYVHARLLERAGCFKTGSITALPVAETTENDLTDYITSNLVGITDGHLLFDTTLFTKGHRPAINPLLSVTRVGRQTQSALHQDVSQHLIAFLVEYEKSQNFSYFVEELTDKVKVTLARGERLLSFFDQPKNLTVPLSVQLIMVGIIWGDFLTEASSGRIHAYRQRLLEAYRARSELALLFDKVLTTASFSGLLAWVKQNQALLMDICKISRI